MKDNWRSFRQTVLVCPNEENTDKIIDENTKLLNMTPSSGSLSLENYANKSGAKLVNISGWQRMLSQRITLYYFASCAGYRNDIYRQQLETAAQEFDKALKTLLTTQENTNEITQSLEDVKK